MVGENNGGFSFFQRRTRSRAPFEQPGGGGMENYHCGRLEKMLDIFFATCYFPASEDQHGYL